MILIYLFLQLLQYIWAQVSQRWKVRDILGVSVANQSAPLTLYTVLDIYQITSYCINVLIIFNCKLSSFCKSSAALMQTVPSSQLGAAYNQSSWYTHKRMNVRNKIKRNPMFWTQVLWFLIVERSNFTLLKWLVGDIRCDEIFIPITLSIAAGYLTLNLCNSVGFLSIDKI